MENTPKVNEDKTQALLPDMNEEIASQLMSELDNLEVEETDKFVMKELLRSRGRDIRFKTDLKDHQITAMVKLLTADKIIREHDKYINNETTKEKAQSVITELTDTYMQLLVSRERKGRLEFIDAWKGRALNDKMSNMVARFTGRGGDI